MGISDCCHRRITTVVTHTSAAAKPHAMSTVTKVVNLFVNLCLMLVAVMHFSIVIDDRNEWCKDVGCDNSDDCSCVGDFLIWNKDDGFDETISNHNYSHTFLDITNVGNNYDSGGWGSVFTVEPVAFSVIWGPFFFALWGLCEHIHPFSPGILYTPKRLFVWYFFIMLFVAFPCAGNWGIITGMFCILPMICCMIMMCLCPKQAVTFRGIYCGCYSYCMDEGEHEIEGGHLLGTGYHVHTAKPSKHHHEHVRQPSPRHHRSDHPDISKMQMGDSQKKKNSHSYVDVKAPSGSKPGDSIIVEVDGKRHDAKIPKGVHPGDSFRFEPGQGSSPVSSPGSPPKSPPRSPRSPPKSPRKQAPSGAVTVTVPAGAKEGDELTVEVDGQELNIQVPAGVKPGASFSFDPASTKPKGKIDSGKSKSDKKDRTSEIEIEVPAGVKGGDMVTIQVDGQEREVEVPRGLHPGDTFTIQHTKKKKKKKKEDRITEI